MVVFFPKAVSLRHEQYLKEPRGCSRQIAVHIKDEKRSPKNPLPEELAKAGIAARYIPDNIKEGSPVVLAIHGMGHSFAHYDDLAMELAGQQACEIVSVALPGHYGDKAAVGKTSYNRFSLEHYRDAVVRQICAAIDYYHGQGKEVVVMGHSMGSLLALMALSAKGEERAALEKVSRVVLLSGVGTSSFCTGITPGFLYEAVVHIDKLLRRLPWTFAKPREHLFNGLLNDNEMTRMMMTMQVESSRSIWQMARTYIPKLRGIWPLSKIGYDSAIALNRGTKVLNIRFGADCLISEGGTARMSRYLSQHGAIVDQKELPGAPHDGMITHPNELARMVAGWLEERKAA